MKLLNCKKGNIFEFVDVEEKQRSMNDLIFNASHFDDSRMLQRMHSSIKSESEYIY